MAEPQSELIEGRHDHGRCPGYRHTRKDGTREILSSEAAFAAVARKLTSPDKAKAALASIGAIDVHYNKDAPRHSVKRPIGRDEAGNLWRENVIALRLGGHPPPQATRQPIPFKSKKADERSL